MYLQTSPWGVSSQHNLHCLEVHLMLQNLGFPDTWRGIRLYKLSSFLFLLIAATYGVWSNTLQSLISLLTRITISTNINSLNCFLRWWKLMALTKSRAELRDFTAWQWINGADGRKTSCHSDSKQRQAENHQKLHQKQLDSKTGLSQCDLLWFHSKDEQIYYSLDSSHCITPLIFLQSQQRIWGQNEALLAFVWQILPPTIKNRY